MRAKFLTVAGFLAGLAAVLGCHHDKYKLNRPEVEEYQLPPDEARFNNPPTQQYRPPPPKKEDTSLLGGGSGNRMPMRGGAPGF